jgi:16S rRNA (uracil1498-N3)-methyltransferase
MQKNKRLHRLFINKPLESNELIILSKDQNHYLLNVLRKKPEDELLIFTNTDGEWLAKISNQKGKIELKEQTRAPKKSKDVTLMFSLIKNNRIDLIFEKATELGVTHFMPFISQYSVANKINMEKARNWVIEAAEQSKRITTPEILELQDLESIIDSWQGGIIIYCDEDENAKSIQELSNDLAGKDLAILVGPEGGFSPEEREYLLKKNFIRPVSLSSNILRAETACICALSQIEHLKLDITKCGMPK